MPSLRLPLSLLVALLASAASSPAHARGSEPVTLRALIEAGRKTYPLLAKKPLIESSLRLTSEKIRRGYWPQLSVGATATWQSDVINVDIPLPNVNIPTPSKEQYAATLNLKQSIWDGGVLAEKRRLAQRLSQVEQEQVNVQWYQVRNQILQLYFAGLVQQEMQAQAKTLESYLETQLKTTEAAQRSGVASERDLLLVKARRIEASQAVSEAQSQLRSIRISLTTLTQVVLPRSSRFKAPERTCETATPVTPALKGLHRPELSLIAAQSLALDTQDKLERATDHPRLAAFATAGYGQPGLNRLSEQADFYFIGGVQLSAPLTYLYSGKRDNAREQLALKKSLLARQRQAAEMQIQVQLDAQQATLVHLHATVALDNQVLHLRAKVRQQTEARVSLGTATMSDLLRDRSQETRALAALAIHRVQRSLACHQLAFIKGDL